MISIEYTIIEGRLADVEADSMLSESMSKEELALQAMHLIKIGTDMLIDINRGKLND